MSERQKPDRFKIGEGAYIVQDTSGVASEGEAMKRQADYSFWLVQEAFASGRFGPITIESEGVPTPAPGSDSQKK